jgi:archaellum component FlaC
VTAPANIQRPRLAAVVKWGVALIGCAVVAPIAFLALKGVAFLLAFGAAVGVGWAFIQFAPVFALVVANLRLKALVGEATRNPIETMKTLYVDKARELETAQGHIEDFQAEISNFDGSVAEFKRQYPGDAASYEEISQKMKAGLREMKQEQVEARAALDDLKERIKKAEMIFKMATAAQAITAMSRSGQQAVFQDIEAQVAFGAVQTKLNRSFASLDSALARRVERPALTPARG